MGSAVVKPLTRRRGKVKAHELVVNSAKSKDDGYVGGSSQFHKTYKVDPVADPRLTPSRSSLKSLKLEAAITNTAPKVCYNSFTHAEGQRLYDSDEEPYPIALARNERMSQTHVKQHSDIKAHPSSSALHQHVPYVSSTWTNRSPLPPDKNYTTITHSFQAANPVPSPEPVTLAKQSEATRLQLDEKARPGVTKIPESRHGLAADINVQYQNASRDARTPSPQYDDLEEIKVTNTKPIPLEHSFGFPVQGHLYFQEPPNPSCSGDPGATIRQPDHLASNRQDGHITEIEQVGFVHLSSGIAMVAMEGDNEKDAHGETLMPNSAPHDGIFLGNRENKSSPSKVKFDDTHCHRTGHTKEQCLSQGDKSIKLSGNTSFSASAMNDALKAETEFSSGCQEDNTIHSSDSFCDVMDDAVGNLGSTRSSAISLNGGTKSKRPVGTKIWEVPSLSNPQVEEILAKGEDFMEGLDEQFVKRYSKEVSTASNHVTKKESFSSRVSNWMGHLDPDFPKSTDIGCTEVAVQSAESLNSMKGNHSLGSHSGELPDKKLPKVSRSAKSLSKSEGAMSLSAPKCTTGNTPSPAPQESSNKLDVKYNHRSKTRPDSATIPRLSSRPPSSANSTSSSEKLNASAGLRSSRDPVIKNIIVAPFSAKESNISVASHSRSRPNSAQSGKTTGRLSSPRVVSSLPEAGMVTVMGNYRPSSSKQPAKLAELRASSKPTATLSDQTQVNPRPQSSHSLRSLNALRPRSGLDRRPQPNTDRYADGTGDKQLEIPMSNPSQSSLRKEGATALKGGGEQSEERDTNLSHDDAELISRYPPPVTLTSNTDLELISVNPPVDDRDKTQWRTAAPRTVPNHRHASFNGPPRLPRPESSQSTAMPKSPRDPPDSSGRSSALNIADSEQNQYDDTEENSLLAKDSATLRQTAWPSRQETNGPCESVRSHETSSSDITVQAPMSLSQDLIGSIRKQLYEEGLKPEERDGGVAFFIPVTEDGLLPQSNNATISDRLTRSKKSSLNYEERMILANINRQAQLSKRREFALRDIRNVRGATPGSEGTDKYKMDDIDSDFDSSF